MTIKKLGRKFLSLFIFLFVLLPVFLYSKMEFTQTISKKDAYINETIKVVLTLKIDDYHNIEQVFFEDYDSNDFWYKKHEDKEVQKINDYTIYTYTYLLDAKGVGEFILPKQLIEVSNNEIRNYRRWKKIYSNEVKINIKPLNQNLQIQGNYNFSAITNKTKIKENESINLSLELLGIGNIDDIKAFNLNLPNQVVYADKPLVKQEFKDYTYAGSFKQDFLVIASESFTIKPFEFTYFNIDKNRVERLTTEPIFIEVEKKNIDNKDEPFIKYIFLIVGIMLGVLISLYYFKYKKAKAIQNEPIILKIKKAKNDKDLYKVLVSYCNVYDFDEVIKKLEENIYNNTKHKIKKKELIKLIIDQV